MSVSLYTPIKLGYGDKKKNKKCKNMVIIVIIN